MEVLGGGAVSYERGTPVNSDRSSRYTGCAHVCRLVGGMVQDAGGSAQGLGFMIVVSGAWNTAPRVSARNIFSLLLYYSQV